MRRKSYSFSNNNNNNNNLQYKKDCLVADCWI